MTERTADEREIALQILMKTGRGQGFSHVNIKDSLDRHTGLRPEERSFIKRLCEGTIEREIELDARIDRFSRKKAGTLRPLILIILRTGIYQICYMDSVPDAAACNEAVKLAKRHRMGNLAGFVNAVLRNTVRAKQQDFRKTTEAGTARRNGQGGCPDIRRGSRSAITETRREARGAATDTWLEAQPAPVRFSIPAWICDLWKMQLGEKRTASLLKAMLAIRPVTVRVDERLGADERDHLIERIRESGVTVQPGRWLPYSFLLTDISDITVLPGFAEGKITVQDESSMLVAEAAGLNGRETVLDVCAAPGGKSMHCASKLSDGGQVFAYDVSAKKADRIRENARRMRLDNLEVSVRDATVPAPEDRNRADVLLCDLPCSGLGVMGRKRDIKYNASLQKIQSLADLQRRILRACAGYVKPGGVLIYSTCTIDRAENEDMAVFIEKLGFLPDELTPFLPDGIPGISGRNHHMIQLLPDTHGTDGFFIARFRKP